jgi:D-glycero-alpha-D-manno-heptose 1-phosphate guanylyltransferase
MEAIILAGGFGTRLRKTVPDLPKPMAPVAGKPFLEILLASLASKGFRRVVLSLGYMADTIVAHFGDHFRDMSLVYEIEREPLGTGGAIRQALTQCQTDHAFVFNGDTFIDLEVAEIELQWTTNRAPILVACSVPDTARYGRVLAAEGRVSGFSEKGVTGPGLINAGCYVLPPHLLDEFPCGQAFSLETDFLAKNVAKERFDLFVTKGRFIDIGLPEDYQRAQNELAAFALNGF